MEVQQFFDNYNYSNLKHSDVVQLGHNYIFKCKKYLLLNIAEHLVWKMDYVSNNNIEICGFFKPTGYCDTLEIFDRTLINYRYKTLKGKFIKLFNPCSDYFKYYFKYELTCILNSDKKFIVTINESLIKNSKQINTRDIPLITPFEFDMNLFYERCHSGKLLLELLKKLYEQIDFNYQKSWLWENNNEIKSAYRNRLPK